VAFTAFRMLERLHADLDLYGLMRLSDDDLIIDADTFELNVQALLDALKVKNEAGEVGLADHLDRAIEEVIKHGIKNIGMYHARPPLEIRKDGRIEVKSMNLLYYYHNRLEGYELHKHLA
jgi:glycerol-3-phosphate O-acyltransferase